ncbi:hypothetical protein VTL71DRAFT_11177 [Oculimacula yallundae]|uniref:Uncharacterized protein n=1 Tax=Oculimacula yallundae TaxID=86028 RepID=A0ABR4CWM9_9HELO
MDSMSEINRNEVGLGCILHLQKIYSDECSACQDHENCALDSEVYGHPVVVVGISPKNDGADATIFFLPMTGSKPSPANKCHLTPLSHKQHKIVTRSKYRLEGRQWMAKETYNRVGHVYATALSRFAPFEKDPYNKEGSKAYTFRLDKDSHYTLVYGTKFAVEVYAPTRHLKRAAGLTDTMEETKVYSARCLDIQPGRKGSTICDPEPDGEHRKTSYVSGSQSARVFESTQIKNNSANLSPYFLVLESYSHDAIRGLGESNPFGDYTMTLTQPVENPELKADWLQKAPSGLIRLSKVAVSVNAKRKKNGQTTKAPPKTGSKKY